MDTSLSPLVQRQELSLLGQQGLLSKVTQSVTARPTFIVHW